MRMTLTIEAVSAAELSTIAKALGGLAATESVGELPQGDDISDCAVSSTEQSVQAEDRAKRRRRTKSELETARNADLAAAGITPPAPTTTGAQDTAPAVEEEPASAQPSSEDADFDVPAFLRGDAPAPTATEPSLQERTEALSESLSFDFVQSLLGAIGIVKMANATDGQKIALEKVVSAFSGDKSMTAQVKAALDKGLSAKSAAEQALQHFSK